VKKRSLPAALVFLVLPAMAAFSLPVNYPGSAGWGGAQVYLQVDPMKGGLSLGVSAFIYFDAQASWGLGIGGSYPIVGRVPMDFYFQGMVSPFDSSGGDYSIPILLRVGIAFGSGGDTLLEEIGAGFDWLPSRIIEKTATGQTMDDRWLFEGALLLRATQPAKTASFWKDTRLSPILDAGAGYSVANN
jgi:hypothetical protein